MTAITLNHLTALMCFFFSCCISLSGQQDGDRLFDHSYLHEIRIEAANKDNLWDTISRDYLMVDVKIDGETIDSVGLKLKGSTSIYSEQKPLELDLNEFVKGKKYDGLKKFGLRNNFKDPYLQKERLAYEIYRRAGLPSPRTSFAELYVDDEFKGVYSLTELIDKTFLKHYYPSSEGSLYKGASDFAGFRVELKEGSMTEFDTFKRNIKASTLADYVNLDHYLKQLAIDILIGDWDSYAYKRHNFYIYFETKSERLHFINWDHNYAFSAAPEDKDLYPVGTYPSLNNLINNPALKSMYQQAMCELLTYVVDSSFIYNLVNHNSNIINSNKNGVVADDHKPLIQYISNRKQRLRDTLTNLGISCDISHPFELKDLVINEFVASNGDDADWIELYNQSSSDLTLDNRFYMSDDKSFPKKWSFPKDVVIPAKGYLIVWADNETNQSGLHAGFKLEKDGGDVLLTYEDMTIIQNINYKKQKKKKSFARVPDGVGEFKIQESTMSGSNNNL